MPPKKLGRPRKNPLPKENEIIDEVMLTTHEDGTYSVIMKNVPFKYLQFVVFGLQLEKSLLEKSE